MSIIKVDVTTELDAVKSDSIKKAENATADGYKMLLDGAYMEERSMLKEAGLDTNLNVIEKQFGINLERKKLEAKMDGDVFSEKEIMELCIKYRLKFLKSEHYRGHIEPTLGAKIVKFFKDKKIDGMSWEARNSLYIMAPPPAFNLERRPDPPRVDPIMFYKISTGEGNMYTMVHKWGNDFTIFRRLLGAIFETKKTWFWSLTVFMFCLMLSVFAICGQNPLSLINIIISVPFAFSLAGLTYAASRGDKSSEQFADWFTKDNWDSTYY